ncbi:MAG: 16S rRNA (guanine(527)-N(7))-methyltransferase RsmG [Calditrichaeota bacterium]|nr:16S rRNA (guanine(527)-N(7))-methyltransferase RsmG [Calditrichota bacterium]
MRNEDREKLENIFALIGEPGSAFQISRFARYYQLLQQWNQRTNLISRSDTAHIVEHHFAESLAIFADFFVPNKGKMLDVGSGGGFPGIPIAILRPELEVFLNESKRMKALFLKEVAEGLDLKNVRVIMDRCENLRREDNLVHSFDFVVTRAVAKLAVVFGWTKALLKKEGFFIAWKGGDVNSEIEELKQNHLIETVKSKEMDHQLVDPARKRCLVYVKV